MREPPSDDALFLLLLLTLLGVGVAALSLLKTYAGSLGVSGAALALVSAFAVVQWIEDREDD